MPGLDFGQLSGNWKKLQETLQADKKQSAQSDGVKRKAIDEKASSTNGFKKARLSQHQPQKPVKSSKMGMSNSKEVTSRSDLTAKHGIPREDVSAAYGATNGALHKHLDDLNDGLHSTHKVGKYVSLDCEMVGTGPPPHLDNVLARASLVNFHGEQIYDSYVLPPDGIKVEDYRTFVSGIKPSHLVKGYARPLKDVQKDVAMLLQGRILVGHALRNDLQALLLSHPKRELRDTSRHPKFRIDSKGKPPALRNLARSELDMEIQSGEHSSVEDARAAMMLFKKDKTGFEEENRKHFGQHTRPQPNGAKKPANGRTADPNDKLNDVDDDEEDEEDEDLDTLDGEDDDDPNDEVTQGNSLMLQGKKKRKKKKRTKRK